MITQPETFPPRLREFVDETTWTFAKTMLEWPHEYIVREPVGEQLFVDLVDHVRTHGRSGRFYERAIVYYEEAGLVYWTMGAPIPRRPSSTGAGKRIPTSSALRTEGCHNETRGGAGWTTTRASSLTT